MSREVECRKIAEALVLRVQGHALDALESVAARFGVKDEEEIVEGQIRFHEEVEEFAFVEDLLCSSESEFEKIKVAVEATFRGRR